MLFAPGVSRACSRTHPSLAERIRELDPRFDVKQLPRLGRKALSRFRRSTMPSCRESMVSRVARSRVGAPASAASRPTSRRIGHSVVAVPATAAIAAQVGQVDTLHIEQAHALRLALPESLREFVESSGQARAVVLGAAAQPRRRHSRASARASLRKSLRTSAKSAPCAIAAPVTENLAPMLRLPALLQVFPALRRLPHRGAPGACAARGRSHPRRRAHRRVRVLPRAAARDAAAGRARSARASRQRSRCKTREADIAGALRRARAASAPRTKRQARRGVRGRHAIRVSDEPPAVCRRSRTGRAGSASRCDRLEKLQPFAKKARHRRPGEDHCAR